MHAPATRTAPSAPAISRAPDTRDLGAQLALVMLVIVAASYVVNAMDRQVFPVLLPNISRDYGFSLAQGGFLSTIFTLGIGIGGIPSGYLLDRVSRKSVIVAGIVIYSVFTLLTAFSLSFYDMATYRSLTGVGEAMQNAALFSAVGAYFYQRRAMALGSLNFAYGLGGFFGPLLGAQLFTATGTWKSPFYVYGLAGLVFVVVILAVVPKLFTERAEESRPGSQSADLMPTHLINRNIVLGAIAAVVVGLSMYGYIGLYPTFLREQLGFSPEAAGFAASMFGLGALMGIPAGYLGDRFNQRWVITLALVCGMVVGYLLFNVARDAITQDVLSFLEGTFGSGFLFVNVYSFVQRSVRPALIGRASGLFVASLYLPSALAGYLFALLVGQVGWGGAAIGQMVLLPIVGIVAMLLVDESRISRASS
jgi:MFS family permease